MPSRQRDGSSPSLLRRLWDTLTSVLVGLVSGVGVYLGVCGLALVVYSAAFPPITTVQLQRQVEGLWTDQPTPRRYAPVPLEKVSPSLPRAVIAAEDSRFFEHHGIDWSMVGEAIEEYQRGEDLRGASTLTQQLVKNLFLTTHSTVVRKALEVPLAYLAELLLSKRRILELYVNVVEWGPGVYGVEEAAAYHYTQSAATLTLAQSAGLAACLPNPRHRRPQNMGWYQRIILQRMKNLGPLPLATGQKRAAPVGLASGRTRPPALILTPFRPYDD